jgi:long-subunit acyl-CoA synthetase (AMP-forming)
MGSATTAFPVGNGLPRERVAARIGELVANDRQFRSAEPDPLLQETARELWENVRAIATAWRRDPSNPVAPGDFVATIGFASPEYLTIDLACAYLGLVAVPAAAQRFRVAAAADCRGGRSPHSASRSRRRPMARRSSAVST